MNPDLPPMKREDLEAKVTALLLGELPDDEAALLRELIARDAELARLRDRLKLTLEFLREATAASDPAPTASQKMSEERREKLLAHFKTVAPAPRWRISLVAVAAVFAGGAILAGLLLPSLSGVKMKGERASAAHIAEDNGMLGLQELAPSAATPAPMANSSPIALPPQLAPSAPPAVDGGGELDRMQHITQGRRGGALPSNTMLFAAKESLPDSFSVKPEQVRKPEFDFSDSQATRDRGVQTRNWENPGLFGRGGGGSLVTNSLPAMTPSDNISLPILGETPVVGGLFNSNEPRTAHFYADQDTRQVATIGDASKDYSTHGVNPIKSNEPADITYDFKDLPLSKLEDIYQGLTGRTLLTATAGPSVSEKEPAITLKTDTPLTRSEAATAVETVLGMNGITTVPIGDKFAKVVVEPPAGMAGGSISANSNPVNVASPQVVQPEVINLRYAQASDIAEALKALGASGGTSVGKSSLGMSATAPTAAPRSKFQNNLRRSNGQTQLFAQAKVIADERNNSLLVFASGTEKEAIQDIVNKLDVAPQQAVSQPATPQPEVLTSSNAFSTFSLNVSDASFKLAQASLRNGVIPDPASIRSEEFINAFDYRDPEPPPGAPIGFSWDQARYPFAHNRDLLRFSVKTAAQGRQAGRPLNLVLLLDKSGSMERADRVEIIHQALRVLALQLQAQDTLSVVVFARTARLWVDGVPGTQAGDIANRLDSLMPEGGTNLEDAMKLAYETALRHYLANGENRVVLLTDGAANLGNVDPETLKQKVEANQKQGVALDCFGIGWDGYNDTLMETLSRAGNGRYGFINTPEEAATEFAGQLAGALRVAASDVKVQVEFNPNRVTAYRQIGYAKHQLKKEQFRDNKVAAAQIGAAESGTALYTVEVNPAGDGPLCTVRVHFRAPGTTDYQEHAWDVPYNGAAGALDQASPAMRLAATASAFSEWLAASPYASEVSPDSLLAYLRGVPEIYGADTRPKNLEWMIRQAKSISGK
jgi:Mg-chelatase subunit ChlD/anti-sigma factor RsiW